VIMDAIRRHPRLLASILAFGLLAAIAVALRTASGAGVQQLTGWIAAAALTRNDLDLRVLDRESGDGLVTYLIVGSDRRSGLPRTLPALGHLTGQYADSIMLWSVRPNSGIVVLALPRDIRVQIPQHGDRKLGSVLDYGAAELVSAVKSFTSLPIHHYIEVNFEGFTGLVDALSGVDIFIESPIRDAKTGLSLPQGDVHLDGNTAVRFARARGVEEMRDGQWIMQSEGDLGRIARQQLLLSKLAVRFHSTRDPATILRAAKNVGQGVIVDSLLTSTDLRRVSRATRPSKVDVYPVVCVLPSKRQIPDDQGASPFPPQHRGSTVLRVVDTSMASDLLRWYASSAAIDEMPARNCSLGIR
jgi:LCP family protein required for cell wall assembly